MALALYRKYRPRTFAEVIGQDHVTEPLSQALRSGRLNHAYLFSGPRGCGKTTSARILARSLNCERGPTPEPCGVCESCRGLAPDGSGSIDVIEIDAASHGGVDDARELRERAFFAPASSRFKIYIIDEAHMVSTQGFNALLKLVEEPPDYVKFIFATTEPDKVLGTIKSRTHHYPFRLIPPGNLRPYCEQLAEAENVKVEPSVFPLVVRAGGGSARDTLSVLDQLIAGAGPDGVSYARAVALLGVTDGALIDEMCDAVAAGDGAAAYATIDRVAEAGHDPRRFASDLLERLRDLIVMQQVPEAAAKGLIDGPVDQLERMNAQAQRLGQATLSRCADIVHNGLIEMRGTTAPRLLLELITARMLLPTADRAESDLLQRLERMEQRLAAVGDQGFASDEPRDDYSGPAVLAGRGPGGAQRPGYADATDRDDMAGAQAPAHGDPPAGGGVAAARAAASRGAAAARAAANAGAAAARAAAAGGRSADGGGSDAARSGGAAARAAAGGSRAPGAGGDAPSDGAADTAWSGAAGVAPASAAGDDAVGDGDADAAWSGPGGGAARDRAAAGGSAAARGDHAGADGDADAAWSGTAGGAPASARGDDVVAGGGADAAANRGDADRRRTEIVPDDQADDEVSDSRMAGASSQRPPVRGSDGAAADGWADEPASNGHDEPPRRVPPQAVMADPATPEPVIPQAGGPGALDAAAVRRVWDEIVTMVRIDNKRIAALASEATVRDIDGDTLVLTFRHAFHARTLAENPEPVSDAAYEVLGSRWQIRCELAGDERAGGPGAGPAPARPVGGREPSGNSSAAGGRAPGQERGARERSSSGRGESGASGDRSSDEDHPADPATRTAASDPAGTAEGQGAARRPHEAMPGRGDGVDQGRTANAPSDQRQSEGVRGPASAAAGSGVERGAQAQGEGFRTPASAAAGSGVDRGGQAQGEGGRGPASAVAGSGVDRALQAPSEGVRGSAIPPTEPSAERGQHAAGQSEARGARDADRAMAPAHTGEGGGWADEDRHGPVATAVAPDPERPGARPTPPRRSPEPPPAANPEQGPARADRQPGANRATSAAPDRERPSADRRGAGQRAMSSPPPTADEEEDWPETALPGGLSAGGDNDPADDWPETATPAVSAQTAAPIQTAPPTQSAPPVAAAAPVAVATAPAPAPQARPAPPAPGGGGAAAAARAAARAAAGRGKTVAAAPPAPQTKAAEADWAGEPPFDPDYDTPGKAASSPSPGKARFEGFDPGDEPTDEVIDERTARQSSEQQAFALLHEALGAERIGEVDLK